MMTDKQIEKLIIEVLIELNEGLPDEEKITITTQTELFGPNAQIDSLSLVSLIVNIESKISNELNYEISITDDRAMIRAESPFLNVQTLKNYILELFDEL